MILFKSYPAMSSMHNGQYDTRSSGGLFPFGRRASLCSVHLSRKVLSARHLLCIPRNSLSQHYLSLCLRALDSSNRASSNVSFQLIKCRCPSGSRVGDTWRVAPPPPPMRGRISHIASIYPQVSCSFMRSDQSASS